MYYLLRIIIKLLYFLLGWVTLIYISLLSEYINENLFFFVFLHASFWPIQSADIDPSNSYYGSTIISDKPYYTILSATDKYRIHDNTMSVAQVGKTHGNLNPLHILDTWYLCFQLFLYEWHLFSPIYQLWLLVLQ